MIDDGTIEVATTLAVRCRMQRDNFIIACHRILYSDQQIRRDHTLHADAAYPVVSAFQVIHILSFIRKNKYISEEQIGDFEAAFTIAFQWKSTNEWMQHVERHELNKQKPLSEQLMLLCEDIGVAIIGSDGGMLFGPVFYKMAKSFLYRNWGIVADHFEDYATSEKYAEVVRSIHNNPSEY